MQQVGYHHANALLQNYSNNIQDQLKQRDTEMVAMLYSIPVLAASSSGSDDSYDNNASDQPLI